MTIARIPYEASSGAEVDDTTVTSINESAGGISGRLSIRAPVIRQFHLTLGPVHETGEVRKIFRSHRTRWPVAVRDWTGYGDEGDGYTYADEVLEWTQNSTETFAPLRRLHQPATGSRYRYERILIPDEEDVDTVVKINGIAISRGAWTFTDFGIVTIPNALMTHSPDRSPDATIVTASGRYMVACCFMDDSLTNKVYRDGVNVMPDVRLREILEDELISLMDQADDSA